jgi:hypothetical protein
MCLRLIRLGWPELDCTWPRLTQHRRIKIYIMDSIGRIFLFQAEDVLFLHKSYCNILLQKTNFVVPTYREYLDICETFLQNFT